MTTTKYFIHDLSCRPLVFMELDAVALTLPPPSSHFIEDRVLQKVRSGLAI
jgi:hypothetical protein